MTSAVWALAVLASVPGPRVVLLPTISGELVSREPRLEPRTLAAFSGALADSASEVFAWRRFAIVPDEAVAAALAKVGGSVHCRSEACAREVGQAEGATHVVFSRLTMQKDGGCAAVVVLLDLLRAERKRQLEDELVPCSADNVLGRAGELGRHLAEGPRAPLRATVSLTPLEVPNLDLPDIPDVTRISTSTATRARQGGLTLERALAAYRSGHMFVFDDAEVPGAFFVTRGGKLLDECQVRRAAKAPASERVREHCEGNSWEWAWIGAPIGVMLASSGVRQLADGNGFAFAFGAGVAVGSALLALFLDEDPVDPTTGRHASSRAELEALVLRANRDLRASLDLTDAEVTVAGMRL